MSGNLTKLDELFLRDISLSDICKRFNLKLIGPNRVINKMSSIHTKTGTPDKGLTYALSENYVREFINSNFLSCIIPASLKHLITENKTFLITELEVETKFFEILTELGKEEKWERVDPYIGKNNSIASSAIIFDNVIIGDGCNIMDNVVIMSNTVIGNNVTIKPNTVIGGDGFLVKKIYGKSIVIPHYGGVKIEDDVEIGSNVCIDKGMFGEFTYIGKSTKIDNTVHVGHSVTIENDCIITAGNVIGGSTHIGENVWLGINSTINQLLTIEKSCFVGSGTVVIKSIKSNLLVVGVPARVIGRICDCRTKLEDDVNNPCPKCGKEFF